MKANEFVRDKGIDVVKEIIKKASFGSHYRVDTQKVICCHNEQHFYFQDLVKLGVDFIKIDDLKRLVESHELVERFGGLENCKSLIDNAPNDTTHFKVNFGVPIFYLESSENDADQARLWIDDECNSYWGLSSYQNYELALAQYKFTSMQVVKQAIADVESCQ